MPIRKDNSTRPHAAEVAQDLRRGRKRIETTFRQICAKLPRRIHAVRPTGFESKVLALFVAFAILVCPEREKRRRLTGSKLG